MPRLLLILLLGAPLAASAAPRPALVLVGGSLEDPRIVDEILRLAGGPDQARIGVITAASGDPKGGARYYERLFAKHGARHVEWLSVDGRHKYRARSATLAQRAEGLNIFFLGGGDQSRLVSCLVEKDGRDTPLLAAIRRAHVRGAVVAGTSAGAAGQAAGVMITGGDSAAARRDAAREGRPRGDDLTFHRGGLGFFPFGIPDTHFSQRGRQDRLIRLAADTGTRRAFGIDENTALIVERPLGQQPKMRALGQGQVTVYDLSRARRAASSGWPVRGVRTRVLGDGDRFVPRR